MEHDLVLTGGTVIDGTGGPARLADVGIADGRIAEIGTGLRGAERLDVTGRLVTPGFVDIHTHYDPQVLWDARLTPSSWHGVTSVVAGNCGFSLAPAAAATRGSLLGTLDKVEDMPLATLEAGVTWDFETYPEYLDAVARRGVALNFGGYVGHTAVRVYVLGDDAYEREATPQEIEAMRAVVAASIEAGALGFSTDRAGFILGDGGRLVPSMAASQEEVEALLRVPVELGKGIVHIAPGENFGWVFDFQRATGARVNWSSILTFPASVTSRAHWSEKLGAHEAARAAGADVWAQVTCRPIVQLIQMREPTPFGRVPIFGELLKRPEADRAACYADPEWRARAAAELDGFTSFDPRWDSFLVAESDEPEHGPLLGRSVGDIGRERGCHPFEVVSDVALASGLRARFSVTFANDDLEGVTALLRGEGTILGLSDAGAHGGQICDAVLPTDFLSRWVRDRGVLPLEQGVRKLTGELADVLGVDRGYLRPGAPADVVVLDYEALDPGPIRRVTDLPAGGNRLIADAPVGVEHVLVNGQAIRRHGTDVDALPGQILRSRPR